MTTTMTKPRQDVLDALRAADKPLGAYDIMDKINPRPKPPTVYRALDYLIESGQVHRIESLNAYIVCHTQHQCCSGHSHHEHAHATQFIVCEDCGRVEEINLPLPPMNKTGFIARKITTEIIGQCEDCA